MTELKIQMIPKSSIKSDKIAIIHSALSAITEPTNHGRKTRFIIPRSAHPIPLDDKPKMESTDDTVGTVKPGPKVRDRGGLFSSVFIDAGDFRVLVDSNGAIWSVPDDVQL